MSDRKSLPKVAREGILAKVAAEARRLYARGVSRVAATDRLSAKYGLDATAVVADAMWEEDGYANPLPSGLSGKRLAAAVAKRRNAGVRWEVLRYSARAAGYDVSPREVRDLYASAGYDLLATYTGRGTRVGAPGSRSTPAASAAKVAAEAAPAAPKRRRGSRKGSE